MECRIDCQILPVETEEAEEETCIAIALSGEKGRSYKLVVVKE
jgi:hypothetical protein